MSIVITHSRARHDDVDGAIANVFGPFADDDAARAWADENVDPRTVWTLQDVTAPF
jgi:hypothetical protein